MAKDITAPQTPIETELPAEHSEKLTTIYSYHLGAKFSKLLQDDKSLTRRLGLEFINGVATVTKKELEVLKKTLFWGSHFSDKPFPGVSPVEVRVSTQPAVTPGK